MKIPVTFTESECRFTPQFGAVVQIGGGGDGEDYQEGYADGKNAGIEEGKQAEYDRIWDGIQDKGIRTHYQGGFYMAGGLDDWFYPKYNLECTSCNSMFRGIAGTPIDLAQRLADCGVVLDTSKATDMTHMFAFCTGVNRLPHISFESVSSLSSPFRGCTNLKTIDKITLSRNVNFPNTSFESCNSLENITFEGTFGGSVSFANSPKLTNASVQSIIDCLKDLTGQTAQTLTLHQEVKAKLTEEQLEAIAAKNWSVA